MLLLWIVLGLANAETPIEASASEAAVEVPSTPTVPVSLTLPEGVTVDPVVRELVSTRSRSGSVHFNIEGKPGIEDGFMTVRGVLENRGRKSARVFVADIPHTGGPFVLMPKGATHPSAVEESSRSPMELNLPAGAKVVYESGLVLTDWTWPEGGAEIDWRFDFWTKPVSGTLEGKLSPP